MKQSAMPIYAAYATKKRFVIRKTPSLSLLGNLVRQDKTTSWQTNGKPMAVFCQLIRRKSSCEEIAGSLNVGYKSIKSILFSKTKSI